MKKLLFTTALGAMALPLCAASSPYQGSVAAPGKYYLYQVESNQWLQPNMSMIDSWTTHGELGGVGIEVELRKLENFEGFQIYVDFTNNGELNGSDEDRFYFDQGDRALCDWIFVPANENGVSNGYKIMIKAKPNERDRDKIANDTYIGYKESDRNNFGGLADNNLTGTTWQLVSREDRINWMLNEAQNGPVDASWLIPWFDRGRNDHREGLWTQDWSGGSGNALDGTWGYPVQEKWNNWTGKYEITLQNLPKGKYSFTVQAFHRDASIDDDATLQRYLNHTDNLDRVKYYAGAVEANVMSIFADPETDNLGLRGEWRDFDAKGGPNGVPNNMEAASRIMHVGHYINPYIQTPVTDGTLTIGIRKTGKADGDWLISKRWYLRYDSEIGVEEILANLNDLIEKCETLRDNDYADIYTGAELGVKKFDDALAAAKQVAASDRPTEEDINKAFAELSALYGTLSSENVKKAIKNYNDLYTVVDNESNAEWAAENDLPLRAPIDESVFEAYFNATSEADFNKAMQDLITARRMRAAIHTEDRFVGQAPVADKKFYLYNVGQKLFLENGSDWGTHASLGHVGVELTLRAKDGENTFAFEAEDFTSGGKFMGGTGYMDTGDQCPYTFIPVEGKSNVYNIYNNNETAYLFWNPFGPVDAGHSSESNVSAHVEGADLNNPNSQWKLVTREERLAMISEASLDNPVDVTLLISRPGFKKFHTFNDVNFWNEGFGWWQENDNHEDNGFESWNSAVGSNFSHQLENLPEGVYLVCINGLYRDGDHGSLGEAQNARFFAGKGETGNNTALLPNINKYRHLHFGSGVAERSGGYYPEFVDQCCTYFRTGLYNAYVVATVKDGLTLPIGVEKIGKNFDNDWIVVDNLRLYYFGPDANEEAVKAAGDPNAYKAQ